MLEKVKAPSHRAGIPHGHWVRSSCSIYDPDPHYCAWENSGVWSKCSGLWVQMGDPEVPEFRAAQLQSLQILGEWSNRCKIPISQSLCKSDFKCIKKGFKWNESRSIIWGWSKPQDKKPSLWFLQLSTILQQEDDLCIDDDL